MIKTSKHNISNITNKGKLLSIESLFDDYKHDLKIYIDYIISDVLPIKKLLSSKLLPTENIKHSQYKQIIYKQASEMLRSQIKRSSNRRYNNYKKIYSYMVNNHPNSPFCKKKYSELKLNNIIKTKYFTTPNINNITINVDSRLFDIKSGVNFDNFILLKLPYFRNKRRALKIKIPLKHHKHSNNLKSKGYTLRNNIQLKCINGEYYINLIWFKEGPNKRTEGYSLGLDLGYKKLITTSNGDVIGSSMLSLYNDISNKEQGSKKFKQLLTHRDNMINYYINNMDLDNIKTIVIEDLNNVKHKSKFGKKFNNKIQRWSYRKTINKLERTCMEKGIELVKVSPSYTSQTCSSCGYIDKSSRNGEEYKCISCGYENDADVNASINICNRGEIYSPSDVKDFSNQLFTLGKLLRSFKRK